MRVSTQLSHLAHGYSVMLSLKFQLPYNKITMPICYHVFRNPNASLSVVTQLRAFRVSFAIAV